MRNPLLTSAFAFVLASGLAGVAEARSHVVAPGETVASIAQHEHVDVAELAKLNDLEAGAIQPGRILVLDEPTAQYQNSMSDPAVVKTRLQAAERAMQPTRGADLAMWGATDGGAGALTASAPGASGEKPSLDRLARRIMNRTSKIATDLTHSAMRFIGVPYSFGGTTASGFDCSGYVQHVFAMLGIHLPRTADAQYLAGARIDGGMAAGDLVFFQTYEAGASHVGIYVGNGEFIHASSSHGVMVSHLKDSYWAARYLGAKRVVASR